VAIRDKEYLKSVFETGDFPIESDYVDLIDSCFSNSVSAQTVYFDDVLFLNGAIANIGIILTNPLGFEYLLTIQDGILSAIKM
jgi:hypothetical protein